MTPTPLPFKLDFTNEAHIFLATYKLRAVALQVVRTLDLPL